MSEKKIESLLERVGLTPLEVGCYLSLIQKSPQRAGSIAKALEVPKATVLAALYRLSDEYGIVVRSKKKNSYLFLVEDVSALAAYCARCEKEFAYNKESIEALVPQLRALQNFEVSKPALRYYEGKEGLKQAFRQVLEEADEIIGYGSNEDDVKHLPDLYPRYYEQRVAKKIPVKAIIPALPFNVQETKKNEMRHLRKTHLIPEEYNFPIQVNIYRNTVIFYSFEESFALVIKSKPIAACLKAIFEFAFAYTETIDKKIRSQKNDG
jgi:sugar-specific transcriptional regulator TrmB